MQRTRRQSLRSFLLAAELDIVRLGKGDFYLMRLAVVPLALFVAALLGCGHTTAWQGLCSVAAHSTLDISGGVPIGYQWYTEQGVDYDVYHATSPAAPGAQVSVYLGLHPNLPKAHAAGSVAGYFAGVPIRWLYPATASPPYRCDASISCSHGLRLHIWITATSTEQLLALQQALGDAVIKPRASGGPA